MGGYFYLHLAVRGVFACLCESLKFTINSYTQSPGMKLQSSNKVQAMKLYKDQINSR